MLLAVISRARTHLERGAAIFSIRSAITISTFRFSTGHLVFPLPRLYALVLWLLGEIEQARAVDEEAVARAVRIRPRPHDRLRAFSLGGV